MLNEDDEILFLEEWKYIWSFFNRLKKLDLNKINLSDEERNNIIKFKNAFLNFPFKKLWELNNEK